MGVLFNPPPYPTSPPIHPLPHSPPPHTLLSFFLFPRPRGRVSRPVPGRSHRVRLDPLHRGEVTICYDAAGSMVEGGKSKVRVGVVCEGFGLAEGDGEGWAEEDEAEERCGEMEREREPRRDGERETRRGTRRASRFVGRF